MNEITYIGGGEVLVSSLEFAELVDKPHEIIALFIKHHRSDLEEFGKVAFETAGGDKNEEFALLNEQQASLLMILLPDGLLPKTFKKNFIKALFDMKHGVSANVPKSFSDVLKAAVNETKEGLS